MTPARPRRTRAALPIGVSAIAAALVLPTAASAAISTTVDVPANDAVLTRESDLYVANPGLTTPFAGTATGAGPGARVDLVCTSTVDGEPTSTTIAEDVPVGSDGRFEAAALAPTTLCRVRAVPDGFDAAASDADLDDYAGPRVRGALRAGGSPSLGPQTFARTFHTQNGQGRGVAEALGAQAPQDVAGAWGAGAKDAGALVSAATADGTDLRSVFGPSAVLTALPGPSSDPANAQLLVDGGPARAWGGAGPSYAQLRVLRRDPVTGDLETRITVPVVRVGADGAAGADAGVVLERSFRQDHEGRLITVHDVLRSADGAAHRVEARYGDSAPAPVGGQDAPRFRVPWTTGEDYVVPGDGTTFGAPPAGGTPTVHLRVAAPGTPPPPPRGTASRRVTDDDVVGAIAFDTPPTDGRFVSPRELATRVVRDVPPGGEATIARRYALGSTVAEVDALLRETTPPPVSEGTGTQPPPGSDPQPPRWPTPTPPILSPGSPRTVDPLVRVSTAARRLLLTRTQAARLRRGKAITVSVAEAPAGRYGVRVRRSTRRGPVVARGAATLRAPGRLALRVRLTAAGRRSFATAAGQRRRVVRSVVTVTWKPAGLPTRTRTTAVRARFR